jgi:1,4-alpha-glucan branching enzyme
MNPRSPQASPAEVVFHDADRDALASGRHTHPHACLGAHPLASGGAVVRVFHPSAVAASVVLRGNAIAMRAVGAGCFVVECRDLTPPEGYRVRWGFGDGGERESEDPYRFLPTVGDQDLHFFGEGRHRRLWEMLGARPLVHQGVAGTAFSVWAPNARRVSVVGPFCHWDGRVLPMRALGNSGVFELFVPEVGAGSLYRFEVLQSDGRLAMKTDPMARAVEVPPANASIVAASGHAWQDAAWMERRPERLPRSEPMATYEVHVGSWRAAPSGPAGFRSLAAPLAEHAGNLGFTHVELLPVTAHPFSGSWGYQTTGYFAPAAQYGSGDDLRHLVDTLHGRGIGVILDWVPAHFPRDDFALRRFDGTALYEHEDPRLGEHPDWGTLIFNYGRAEVRNFLMASALFWLEEMHFDGLRVDAVASMLYRDYSRRPGQWVPNRYGGRENLEAIDFLRDLNAAVAEEAPGCLTAAEESTSWPGVTAPREAGGLGFTFKWNMGWMNDSLRYFAREPVYRRHHQDELTFAGLYDRDERFILPLSHDEVVHGKGSFLARMPGDDWQRLANLRLLLAWQFLRPGKKLLFMGTELAPEQEWNENAPLDWGLAQEPARDAMIRYVGDLSRFYRSRPELWARDDEDLGVEWISVDDREQSVVGFARWDFTNALLCVLNLTPVPRSGYRVGAPRPGAWRCVFDGDAPAYGGSGFDLSEHYQSEPVPAHGKESSLVLTLPPLAAIVLESR